MPLIVKKNLIPLDINLVRRIMRNLQYSKEETIIKSVRDRDSVEVFFAVKAAKIMLQNWEE